MNIYFSKKYPSISLDDFQAVSITLDASLHSLLEWKEQILEASNWKEKGKYIFWFLDFGDYDLGKLETLRLGVEHFEKQVWETFRQESVGVCLYKGSCELNDDHIGFLESLAGSLPDDAEAFLLLDVSSLNNAIEISRAISKERFPYFTLAVKGIDLPIPEYGWETTAGARGMIGERVLEHFNHEPLIGVCVPSEGTPDFLEEMVQKLKNSSIPFRMIPESLITTEWQGLDHIIVDSESVSPLGVRRLMGFCAAGGTIVTLGEMLGLPLEVSAQEWEAPGIVPGALE